MKRRLFLMATAVAGLSLAAGPLAYAGEPTGPMRDLTSLELAKEMSPGWNLGNTLEAFPDETSWGNPRVTQKLMYRGPGGRLPDRAHPRVVGQARRRERPDRPRLDGPGRRGRRLCAQGRPLRPAEHPLGRRLDESPTTPSRPGSMPG